MVDSAIRAQQAVTTATSTAASTIATTAPPPPAAGPAPAGRGHPEQGAARDQQGHGCHRPGGGTRQLGCPQRVTAHSHPPPDATPGSGQWHDDKIPATTGHASLAGGTRGRACYAVQRSTCSLLVAEFLPESVTKLHRVTQRSCRPGISREASTLLSLIQRNICTVLTHAPGRGVVPGERPAAACGG